MLIKKHANNLPQELSPDAFNDFFANVGAQLAEKFQNDTLCWTMPECVYQCKFSDVQHEFVHTLLLSLFLWCGFAYVGIYPHLFHPLLNWANIYHTMARFTPLNAKIVKTQCRIERKSWIACIANQPCSGYEKTCV